MFGSQSEERVQVADSFGVEDAGWVDVVRTGLRAEIHTRAAPIQPRTREKSAESRSDDLAYGLLRRLQMQATRSRWAVMTTLLTLGAPARAEEPLEPDASMRAPDRETVSDGSASNGSPAAQAPVALATAPTTPPVRMVAVAPLVVEADYTPVWIGLYAPSPVPHLATLRCITPCRAEVPSGRYRLFVGATSYTRAGST